MAGLVWALALIWIVPLVLAASAAIFCRMSRSFQTWLNRELFGDSLSEARIIGKADNAARHEL